MSRKITLFLAVLVILVIGFIVLGIPLLDRSFTTIQPGSKVLNFSLDDVQALEIKQGAESLRFTRETGGWSLGPIPKDHAATPIVESILTAAQNLRIIDVISKRDFEGKFKSRAFGLATPKVTLRLETKQGPLEVLFGREGIGEDRIYVRSGRSKETYLVADELHKLLIAPIDQFRDPRLVAIPNDRIERILLRRLDGEIELERKGEKWQIIRPLQTSADTAKVDKLLEQVLAARISQFLGEEDATKPLPAQGEIHLWEEGVDTPIILKLANAKEQGHLRVHQSARNASMIVSLGNFALLGLPLDELRSRQLLDLNSDFVDRFSVRLGEKLLEFSRNEQAWTLRYQGTSHTVKPAEVDALFSLLNQQEVKKFNLRPVSTSKENQKATSDNSPNAEIHFNAWLSENTPETTAGLHPLATLRIWKLPDGNAHIQVNDTPSLLEVPNTFLLAIENWAEKVSSPSETTNAP